MVSWPILFLSHVKMCLTLLNKVVLFFSSHSQRTKWELGFDDLPSKILRVVSQAGKLALNSLVSIILICMSPEAILPVKGGVKEVSKLVKARWKITDSTTQMSIFSRIKKLVGHKQASFLTSPEICSTSFYSRRWEQEVTLDQTLCFQKFTRNGPL